MASEGPSDALRQERAIAQFAAAMDAVDVRYMIVGSAAMNYYAEPRMTRDVDVIIDPAPSDARFVARVISEDFDADAESIEAEVRRGAGGLNAFTRDMAVRFDVMLRDRTIDPDAVFDRRRTFELDGQAVLMVSAEDLVVAKVWWARDSKPEMQFRDVRNLLDHAAIELDYVERRCRELGLSECFWRRHGAGDASDRPTHIPGRQTLRSAAC